MNNHHTITEKTTSRITTYSRHLDNDIEVVQFLAIQRQLYTKCPLYDQVISQLFSTEDVLS